jgi:predicted transcriptional regulator
MRINPNGDKMECNKCQGTGWYKVPNHRLEIMENVECMDCLLNQQFKDHLKEELTLLLVNTSPQKLAQIVAQLVVNSVDRNENDDIQRIEGIIHTKNVINALVLAEAYSQ